MGKQHNRRILAGFYKRYDGKYIYVVAAVPDADTGEKVLICHEGLYADKDKIFTMTKQSFCEMVEVDGEWVDKEVQLLLAKCYEDAVRILQENRALLDEIAAFLLAKETITGDELMAYVNADK